MSKIEWLARPGTTPEIWNPIKARHRLTDKVGWFCIHKSVGCVGCDAEAMNAWRGNRVQFRAQNLAEVEVFLDEDTLREPLHWSKPRTCFPCSMTDLYGEWIPDEMIDRVEAVMALAAQHTFIVLTKRARRQREYVTRAYRHSGRERLELAARNLGRTFKFENEWVGNLPAVNIWRCVSAENQETANERVHELRLTPAIVRGVSAEPLLGPIDFTRLNEVASDLASDALRPAPKLSPTGMTIPALDWIVVGGHSGIGAKPFDLAWARSIIEQCRDAGVACFVKQIGSNPVRDDGQYGFRMKLGKGGNPEQWPLKLRVREWPKAGIRSI